MAESHTTPRPSAAQDNAAYQRTRRAEKVAAGVCVRCARPAIAGRTMCEQHKNEHQDKRANRRYHGRCFHCSHEAVAGRSMCQRHLDTSREKQQRRADRGFCRRCPQRAAIGSRHCDSCLRQRATEEKVKRKRNAEAGLCVACSAPADGKVFCPTCREKSRKHFRRLKIETLEAYGGCFCVCCGEHRIEFLTIEHPAGDGKSHRDAIAEGRGGRKFYLSLKRLGFPREPRLVVNCFNCNLSKNQFGICPHEVERLALLSQM